MLGVLPRFALRRFVSSVMYEPAIESEWMSRSVRRDWFGEEDGGVGRNRAEFISHDMETCRARSNIWSVSRGGPYVYGAPTETCRTLGNIWSLSRGTCYIFRNSPINYLRERRARFTAAGFSSPLRRFCPLEERRIGGSSTCIGSAPITACVRTLRGRRARGGSGAEGGPLIKRADEACSRARALASCRRH